MRTSHEKDLSSQDQYLPLYFVTFDIVEPSLLFETIPLVFIRS